MCDLTNSRKRETCPNTGRFNVRFTLPTLAGALEGQLLLSFAWLLLATPVAVQAQFTYLNNNGTLAITGYAGTNNEVAIPSTIDGWPVTAIGNNAFDGHVDVTNITFPNSLTSIGEEAFAECVLTSITVPSSVTSIGRGAFSYCPNLTNAYFQGNAPLLDVGALGVGVRVYYLPGTVGWTPLHIPIYPTGSVAVRTFQWTLPYPFILTSSPSFGVQSNGFGFTVSWATNLSVVVEGTTGLKYPNWSPLLTNALNNGVINFTDREWRKYPNRFYRVRAQ